MILPQLSTSEMGNDLTSIQQQLLRCILAFAILLALLDVMLLGTLLYFGVIALP